MNKGEVDFLPPFSRKIFLQHFLQHFSATISRNNFLLHFPQQFPARFSCKICLQDFPELDPDWLAPHHPIPNAKFSPITGFLKLAFSTPPFTTRFSHKNFPQQFPARFSCNNFLQDFPTKFSSKIFLSWILIRWFPITLFQMLNFHQSQPFLNWLFPSSISCKNFLQEFPARFSRKIFSQQFPARFSCNNFPQDFPTRISHKIFPQQFPIRFSHKNFPLEFPIRFSCKIFLQDFSATISHKNFPQDFPELDPDWMAPHHPIPKAKFPLITAFLKLVFSPPPFPARFFHKNFPQDFPATISHKIFPSWILIGWLPITLFQMLNFHQSLPC